jgi:hypothetical protein
MRMRREAYWCHRFSLLAISICGFCQSAQLMLEGITLGAVQNHTLFLSIAGVVMADSSGGLGYWRNALRSLKASSLLTRALKNPHRPPMKSRGNGPNHVGTSQPRMREAAYVEALMIPATIDWYYESFFTE